MQTELTTYHRTNYKICSKCKMSRPISEFGFRHKAAGTHQSYCKECGKTLTRSHYRNNKRQYLD